MSIIDYAGYWTGIIEGTNQAGLVLDIKQEGDRVSGTANLSERDIGE